MKKIILFLLFLYLLPLYLLAQPSIYYSVQVKVSTQEVPPKITLNWPLDSTAGHCSVGRKTFATNTWTYLAASLPGNATSFIDSNVVAGTQYEYSITRGAVSYICAGIKVPVTEYRGKLILIVDNYFADTLSAEISRLESDLIGDGWVVIRHDVARTDSVPSVKNLIVNDYYSDSANVKALFLLGHVPVPYSGNFTQPPDGHTDHGGAWPADVFYADINGTWTDVSVNNVIATRTENHNVPGDGKYDQSNIPSDVDLQTGRVDFYNLPSLNESETQLMKKYLDRNHDYRMKNFDVSKRCLIDSENFGTGFQYHFGMDGWNIAAIVSPDSVSEQDYFSTLDSESYQWSNGCGWGSFNSCYGVGSTSDFAAGSVKTIFTLLFGSWFGDWDSQDNFLRAALASGALTSAWSGRPSWHFHQMALGETIGFCTRISQNNSAFMDVSGYQPNGSVRWIHIALMGDPTLREHIITPPSNLVSGINMITNYAELHWTPSLDAVLGYYVFKLDTSTGIYNRISTAIINDTNFIDTNVTSGHYMVRAIRLESSATGTYYNMSQGIFNTDININGILEEYSENTVSVYPNPAMNTCVISSEKNINDLLVYNELSQLLIKVANIERKEFSLDLSSLDNGVYFLKIDNSIKKLCVIKK